MKETQRHFIGEIISIGDEITNGSILDTNSQWLSRELAELGVRVLYHDTVGDDQAAMVAVFREAARRSDLVIVSGGLGPTEDDLTRQAVAEAFDCELVQDVTSLEHVKNHFARRGRVMPDSNLIQSYFPKGANVIFNPHGTAPGFRLELNRRQIAGHDAEKAQDTDKTGLSGNGSFCLMTFPGVPAELKEMWFDSARDEVALFAARSGLARHFIRMKKFLCFGAGESELESRLGHLIRRDHIPTVGITASEGIISLRILAEGESEEECQKQIDETSAYIQERVGDLIFGYDNQTMQEVVSKQLRERHQRLATLEWGTRGMLAARIDTDVFAGGTVMPEKIALNKDTLAEALARCREQGQADYLLVVGPYPKQSSSSCMTCEQMANQQVKQQMTCDHGHHTANTANENNKERVMVRLLDVQNDTLYEEEFSFGLHPAIIDTLFCTRALDLLRRKMN